MTKAEAGSSEGDRIADIYGEGRGRHTGKEAPYLSRSARGLCHAAAKLVPFDPTGHRRAGGPHIVRFQEARCPMGTDPGLPPLPTRASWGKWSEGTPICSQVSGPYCVRGALEANEWSWEILGKGDRVEVGDRRELQRMVGCRPFKSAEKAMDEADRLWLAGNRLTKK